MSMESIYLAIPLSSLIMRKRNKIQVNCQQHQFNTHQRDDRVKLVKMKTEERQQP